MQNETQSVPTLHRRFDHNESPTSRWMEGKGSIYLLLSAIGVFVLFPQITGTESVIQVVKRADTFYLVLALIAETARYLVSAGSTYLLARLFNRPAEYIPLVESFFAGTAANRTFSTGGAPGMIVRTLFLMKRGLSTGMVAALFLIEDVAGAMVGGIVLFIGALLYWSASQFDGRPRLEILASLVVGVTIFLGVLYLYQRKEWVERVAHSLASTANQMSTRLLGRAVYDASRLQNSLAEFYAAMKLARDKPAYALSSLGLNAIRYLAGALALYFSFSALGWQLSVPALILLSTLFSLLTAISAAPAEVVIMGAGFAVVTFYFNAPKEITLVALLLSRALSFWLPIPIGYLAWWNLKRRDYL